MSQKPLAFTDTIDDPISPVGRRKIHGSNRHERVVIRQKESLDRVSRRVHGDGLLEGHGSPINSDARTDPNL
jgi:hypothetical protein